MSFNTLKKYLALVIIASFVFSIFPIQTASAQEATGITETIIGGLTCTAGTTISSWLVGKITNGIKSLAKGLGNKLAGQLGLTAFLNRSVPTDDLKNNDKEGFLDVVARCFAREIMNDITARMIGAARTSGRDGILGRGEPSFVRDWRRFLSNAQYRGENVFRSMLNHPSLTLCNNVVGLKNLFNANGQPPTTGTAAAGLRIGNLNSYNERINCTMPRGWTTQNYVNDFAGNGSWEALTRLAEPQNNYYGALLISMSELAAQRAHEEKSDSQEAGPSGFTARRGKPGESCLVYSNNGRCVVYKDILTPGSVISNAVQATIQEELTWITSVDEWNELISYVMSTLMSRILNLAQPSAYDQEDFPREAPPKPWDGDSDLDIGSGSGPGQPPQPPSGSITVCSDINYQGTCETFSSDDPDLSNNSIGTNRASSILVGSATTALLYDLTNYGGGSRAFNSNLPSFLDVSFNDIASSIQITATTGLTCSEQGLTNNYESQVQTAISSVVNNTTLDEGQTGPGNEDAMGAFLDAVVVALRGAGMRAGRVNNGTLSIDSIIVGQASDPDGTVYKIIADATSSSTRIGNKLGVTCADHAPWSALRDPQGVIPGSDVYGMQLRTSGGQPVSSIDDYNASLYGYLAVLGSMYNTDNLVLYDINGGTLESGDSVAIQNLTALYFSAQGGGGSILKADATNVGSAETFTIRKSDGSSGTISSGMQVNFRGSTCCFMVAVNGGNGLIRFDSQNAGAWETFTITLSAPPSPLPQPGVPPPSPGPQVAECDDNSDNDGDGFIDYNFDPNLPNTPPDPECVDQNDTSESN